MGVRIYYFDNLLIGQILLQNGSLQSNAKVLSLILLKLSNFVVFYIIKERNWRFDDLLAILWQLHLLGMARINTLKRWFLPTLHVKKQQWPAFLYVYDPACGVLLCFCCFDNCLSFCVFILQKVPKQTKSIKCLKKNHQSSSQRKILGWKVWWDQRRERMYNLHESLHRERYHNVS